MDDEVLFCMRVPSETIVDSSLIEPWLDKITMEIKLENSND